MRADTIRINMLPRLAVRHYVPPDPAHWDLKKLVGKWYWRPLAWCLRKLGAEWREWVPASYPMQVVEIHPASILEMIARAKHALQLLWEKQATILIVGYDEMEKLMNEPPTEIMQFDMPFPIANGQLTEVRRLRVVLVPWLSGWALLPDLDK